MIAAIVWGAAGFLWGKPRLQADLESYGVCLLCGVRILIASLAGAFFSCPAQAALVDCVFARASAFLEQPVPPFADAQNADLINNQSNRALRLSTAAKRLRGHSKAAASHPTPFRPLAAAATALRVGGQYWVIALGYIKQNEQRKIYGFFGRVNISCWRVPARSSSGLSLPGDSDELIAGRRGAGARLIISKTTSSPPPSSLIPVNSNILRACMHVRQRERH